MIPQCAANRHIHFTLDGSGPARFEPPDLRDWPEIALDRTKHAAREADVLVCGVPSHAVRSTLSEVRMALEPCTRVTSVILFFSGPVHAWFIGQGRLCVTHNLVPRDAPTRRESPWSVD